MSAPEMLAALQHWLFDRVTEPAAGSHAGAVSPSEMVVSGSLSAADRVEVYRHGYVARLVECLEDDYPALQHALGAAPFEQLCRGFIRENPPPSPSLNYYGAPFARYVAMRPERWSAPAAELARLEWAIVEAIHAEEGARLDIAALAQLTPEQWSRARLVPSPTLRLLRTTCSVAEHYQAFQQGNAVPEQWPAAEPSAVAVCRREQDVWRVRIAPALAPLLASLMEGMPLLAALDHCSAAAGAADGSRTEPVIAPEELQAAFRDWVGCGMFAAVAFQGS
jgi:hypothetical protein